MFARNSLLSLAERTAASRARASSAGASRWSAPSGPDPGGAPGRATGGIPGAGQLRGREPLIGHVGTDPGISGEGAVGVAPRRGGLLDPAILPLGPPRARGQRVRPAHPT